MINVSGDSREIDRLVKDRLRSALSVYEVFPDVLERLQPTHIITQTQCEVCAVSLKDVEAALSAGLPSSPKVVPLNPNSLADVWDDMRRVARSLGSSSTAHRSSTVCKPGCARFLDRRFRLLTARQWLASNGSSR